MNKLVSCWLLAGILMLAGCAAPGVVAVKSEPQLLRVSYHSELLKAERDTFVYLPAGFETQEKWPVLLFLHGNGERGDGQGELDYVLKHGPLFEAWCQRRDLPFVIIAPQMPMQDQGEVDYIKSRKLSDVPQRKADGSLNRRPWFGRSKQPMDGQPSMELPARLADLPHDPRGWNILDAEVMGRLDHVLAAFKGDPRRVYLTGLSSGGIGTWVMAATHPDRFAAIAPVVGYGPPDLAPALAAARVPVWAFAGGRDNGTPVKFFYPLLNELEKLGHPEVRFTIEADLGHDAFIRAYAGDDLYRWFLTHTK